MTRDEITALAPGRDLDFAVARALGWTDIRPPTFLTSAIDGYTGMCPQGHHGADGVRRYVPEFSASRGLGPLLEALDQRPKGTDVRYEFFIERHADGTWSAQAGPWSPKEKGQTFSEAVCRALLFEYHSHGHQHQHQEEDL